jgi:alpha-mannosidase/mannosylglycerate hydrolase
MGPRVGYCDFAFNIRHAHEAEVIVDFEHLHQALDDYIQLQASRCQLPMPILLFDGGDHQQAEPRTGNVVQALANNGLAERFELRMGTLDDLAAAMRSQDASGLPVMHGELRNPGVRDGMDNDQQWVIPGVLSSRIHLKQANARCESLLTQWAEPWSLFATAQGLEYPHGFLRIAWRQLLMNHAHDSICGCSQDQVHRDMEYRFDQARMVAERLQRAALEQLARGVAFPAAGETPAPRRLLLVANPTSRAIDEPVDLLVRLPETTPAFQEYFGYEPKPGFWLRTAGGESVPYQRVAQSSGHIEVQIRNQKFPKPVKHHQIEVTARLRIPAFGYTALAIEPSKGFTRHTGASLVTGVRRAENEFLQLEIDPQGLLNLIDKRSGQRFAGLLELEDRADIGDGWYHGTAVNDQVFYSGAVSAAVACVADGPERAEFLIEMDWTLPTRFEFDAMRRAPERTTLHVEHRVTLRAGCARVEVRTVVQNTLKDHRLRVLFPTGTQAESYLSDTPFDVVRRSIKPDPRHVTWRELEVETKPQHTWTAIHDEQRGLAVVSQGLPESAVPDLAERPIALTLFRGFKKTVFTQGEPGGQIAGQLSFSYWLVPLAGAPDVTELCYLGQRLAGGLGQQLCNWQSPAEAAAAMPAAQSAASTAGFLEVAGDVVVTAVRANAAGQMVVRLFNPTEAATVCTLQRPQGLTRAWQCNLEEQPRQALEVRDAAATFEVAPHRIMTLLLD